MTDKTNGIASAADFKRAAESSAWGPEERVVLPQSGLAVILRRPTLMYFRLRRATWPEALLEKLEVAALTKEPPKLTPEESLFLIREDVGLIQQAFVQPRMELHPGPDAIDPNWLAKEDTQFIIKYLGGQVLADGTDLETFPGGQPIPAADGGDSGGEVPGTAIAAAAKSDARLAN